MKQYFITLLLIGMLMHAFPGMSQRPLYPKPNSPDQIPFGKKLPPVTPPQLNQSFVKKGYENEIYNWKYDKSTRQFVYNLPGKSAGFSNYSRPKTTAKAPKPVTSDFQLTRDINTLAESFPSNYPANAAAHFAVLNNISYFSANDGNHGSELWRSDGTDAGTYLVKDINPGADGSSLNGIVAINGLLYFSASTVDKGFEPWVSDGTEAGTHLLKDIAPDFSGSNPSQFVKVGGQAYFAVSSFYGYNDELWKTDGTESGTTLVKSLTQSGIGYGYIFELTGVGNTAYFLAYNYYSGFQLFVSDGTDAGTNEVRDIGYNYSYYDAPLQLTAYNNQLFFSANDGSGRRLWVSDGTFAGTTPAPGFNDVFMQPDYLDPSNNTPFPILNNALYISGYTYADGSGLYKYDASITDGIVLIKDLTPGPETDFVVPVDMRVVGSEIYFKVINSSPEWHDELWKTDGTEANTMPVKVFDPGRYIYGFVDYSSTLFFDEYDDTYGNELWTTDGTDAGTMIVKDISPGTSPSYPNDVTVVNGILLFASYTNEYGTELWKSDGFAAGTALVKDINTTTTDGSNAGFMYRGLIPFGNGVLFNAYTPQLGAELYKSDGTSGGTVLVSDITQGTSWSYPNDFTNKGNFSYFIGDDLTGTAIYRTDGTTAGLRRVTAYISRDFYFVYNFAITDKGGIFYVLGNKMTGAIELWFSNGTASDGNQLNTNLYYNSYVSVIGNTGIFVAGDYTNGYEIWKSDGTSGGTKIVKDIFPGNNGSYPYSLFAFKGSVYFGAYDGFGFNNEFWKTDGTEKGTVKVKNITPAYFNESFVDPPIPVYCPSNNKLYFTATDFNTYGAELWVTNGTEAGTRMVKDINPYYDSYPNHLTDVDGTLYFTATDGVHGMELWSSAGRDKSTQMVKDITPYGDSYLFNLTSAGGKLYFLNPSSFPTLWSSDGTAAHTGQVADNVVNGLYYIKNLTGSGDKLFFGGVENLHGTELYEGDARGSTLNVSTISANTSLIDETPEKFVATIFPNPAKEASALRLKGDLSDVTVLITDMSGKVIWKQVFSGQSEIKLPVQTLSAGVYNVSVANKGGSLNVRFVKE